MSVNELTGVIVKLVTDRTRLLLGKSPTPETVMSLLVRASRSSCVSRLEINEVEEALSSNARAVMEEPLGATTLMRQVINSALELTLAMALAETRGVDGKG